MATSRIKPTPKINDYNSSIEKDTVRKAFHHLTEARDLLCCACSPLGHVADQERVQAEFVKFVKRLKKL